MTWRRKKCVEIAKKIAKIRDKFICQWCGKLTQGNDCHGSHIIPESKNKYLSCEPINIKVLCYNCHAKRHENPLEAAKRINEKRPDRIEYLTKENLVMRSSIGIPHFVERLKTLKEELESLSP